ARRPRLRLRHAAHRSSRRMRHRGQPTVRHCAHHAVVSWRSTRAAGQGGQANRQVAVVDLGSNSWRLAVFTYADPPDPWWKLTDELYETVRIGAGLAATGKLSYEAIGRGLETLGVFARFCRANHLEADDIHVVATSAIRDATNGEQFLADAQA